MSRREVCEYIVDNIEKLYDPFFEAMVFDSRYENNNILCRYLHKILKKNINIKIDEEDFWIKKIKNFYQGKTEKEIIKSLSFYECTGNKKDCVILLAKSKDLYPNNYI